MANLPKKYIISKNDTFWFGSFIFDYFKDDLKKKDFVKQELIALLNFYKPNIIIRKVYIFNNKFDSKLNLKKFNLRYINIIQYPKVIIIWNDKNKDKQALFLYLYYYQKNILPTIIIKNNYKLIPFHYITGKLLGYKNKEIQEYYIKLYLVNKISRKLYKNIFNEYKLLKTQNKNKKYKNKISIINITINNIYKDIRLNINKYTNYNKFLIKYYKLIKLCDKYIKKILNNDRLFNKYQYLIKKYK